MNNTNFKIGQQVTHINCEDVIFEVVSDLVFPAATSEKRNVLVRPIKGSDIFDGDILLWEDYLTPVKPRPTIEQIVESSKRRDARVNDKIIQLQNRIAALTKQMRDLINKNNAKRRRSECLIAGLKRNG
jgi:hypothetical protein